MKRLLFFCGVFVSGFAALADPARGVIVELSDGKRAAGRMVKDEPGQIVIAARAADGGTENRTIERKSIQRIIVTVEPKRLEELKPSEPESYRELAEEIAAKKEDPEARETALRLYLIAAYRDPTNLGRGCLKAMAELAETPEESRRYQAMAYVLDPKRQGTEPKIDFGPALTASPGASGSMTSNDFLKCLRAYREGKYKDAANLVKKPAAQRGFQRCKDVLRLEDFLEACASGMTPQGTTIDQARKTEAVRLGSLRAEAREIARSIPPGKLQIGAPAAGAKESWSITAHTRGLAPVRPLDLEAITDFDPRESVFRGDRWIKP